MDTLDTCGCPYRNYLKYGVNRWNYLIIWANSHRHNRILLNSVGKRILSCLFYSFRGFLHRVGIATIALGGVLMHDEIYADSDAPPIDERCESYELRREINLPIRRRCLEDRDACIDERMNSLNESLEQAEIFCWQQPLSIDPRYVGPCPSYLEELEGDAFSGDEWILERVNLRMRFEQSHPRGAASLDRYKRKESVQLLRRLLAKEPNNVVALGSLKTHLDRNEIVEKLTLEMKLHELDPDCTNTLWTRKGLIFNHVNQLSDNWLTESGVGSELSNDERRELLQGVRNMLLEMYDVAVEQKSGTDRLYWALESIHDAVLSGMFKNLQQIYDHHQIEFHDYSEERRKEIVHDLSSEYGVNSKHGRTKALSMMCNDYAFELGLNGHCLELLEYFGRKDSKSLATDWAKAAVLLTNWLTRDCSQLDVLLLDTPIWWSNRNRRCAEEREKTIEQVEFLLSRFSQGVGSAEANLLRAYLNQDESSDEYFIRALNLDSSMLPYGARLSKRLLKRGHHSIASNIMSRIHKEDQSKLISGEIRLIQDTSETVKEGIYSNSFEKLRVAFSSDEE